VFNIEFYLRKIVIEKNIVEYDIGDPLKLSRGIKVKPKTLHAWKIRIPATPMRYK
jgi:hypothetical protein